MNDFRHLALSVAAAAIVLSACAAEGQTLPRIEVAGGYARLTDASASLNTTTGRPDMSGWNVDIAVVKSRRLSWVGAVDGAAGRDDGQSAFGDRNEWTDLSAAGGIRLTGRWNEKVVPYVHLLGWIFHTTQTYLSTESFSIDTTALFIQLGTGVNVMLNPRLGVRLAIDVKTLPNFDWVDETAGNSMTSVFLGGVLALGRQ